MTRLISFGATGPSEELYRLRFSRRGCGAQCLCHMFYLALFGRV